MGTFYAVVRIVLMAFMMIASIFVIIVVLKQKGDVGGGMSALQGSSASDTFYGKNKAKNKEALLKKLTYIALGVIGVSAILFFIVTNLANIK
ncbi:MAG: preprotein translocase subunit SecG [Clostridia bacterium]